MDNLQLLRKLGLTEYESKVYLALATLGPSTVRDVVRESKVPRNKAYEALDNLVKKDKLPCPSRSAPTTKDAFEPLTKAPDSSLPILSSSNAAR